MNSSKTDEVRKVARDGEIPPLDQVIGFTVYHLPVTRDNHGDGRGYSNMSTDWSFIVRLDVEPSA